MDNKPVSAPGFIQPTLQLPQTPSAALQPQSQQTPRIASAIPSVPIASLVPPVHAAAAQEVSRLIIQYPHLITALASGALKNAATAGPEVQLLQAALSTMDGPTVTTAVTAAVAASVALQNQRAAQQASAFLPAAAATAGGGGNRGNPPSTPSSSSSSSSINPMQMSTPSTPSAIQFMATPTVSNPASGGPAFYSQSAMEILSASRPKIPASEKQRKREKLMADGVKKRFCNCKQSRCLKLYCDCFANGSFCDPEVCACLSCANQSENPTRKEAVGLILERNANAFKPKVQVLPASSLSSLPSPSAAAAAGASHMEPSFPDIAPQTPSSSSGTVYALHQHQHQPLYPISSSAAPVAVAASLIHAKGCNCKKSGCLKRYCECFQNGAKCGEHCKCIDCKNRDVITVTYSHPHQQYMQPMTTPSSASASASASMSMPAPLQLPLDMDISQHQPQQQQGDMFATPSAKSPSNMTATDVQSMAQTVYGQQLLASFMAASNPNFIVKEEPKQSPSAAQQQQYQQQQLFQQPSPSSSASSTFPPLEFQTPGPAANKPSLTPSSSSQGLTSIISPSSSEQPVINLSGANQSKWQPIRRSMVITTSGGLQPISSQDPFSPKGAASSAAPSSAGGSNTRAAAPSLARPWLRNSQPLSMPPSSASSSVAPMSGRTLQSSGAASAHAHPYSHAPMPTSSVDIISSYITSPPPMSSSSASASSAAALQALLSHSPRMNNNNNNTNNVGSSHDDDLMGFVIRSSLNSSNNLFAPDGSGFGSPSHQQHLSHNSPSVLLSSSSAAAAAAAAVPTSAFLPLSSPTATVQSLQQAPRTGGSTRARKLAKRTPGADISHQIQVKQEQISAPFSSSAVAIPPQQRCSYDELHNVKLDKYFCSVLKDIINPQFQDSTCRELFAAASSVICASNSSSPSANLDEVLRLPKQESVDSASGRSQSPQNNIDPGSAPVATPSGSVTSSSSSPLPVSSQMQPPPLPQQQQQQQQQQSPSDALIPGSPPANASLFADEFVRPLNVPPSSIFAAPSPIHHNHHHHHPAASFFSPPPSFAKSSASSSASSSSRLHPMAAVSSLYGDNTPPQTPPHYSLLRPDQHSSSHNSFLSPDSFKSPTGIIATFASSTPVSSSDFGFHLPSIIVPAPVGPQQSQQASLSSAASAALQQQRRAGAEKKSSQSQAQISMASGNNSSSAASASGSYFLAPNTPPSSQLTPSKFLADSPFADSKANSPPPPTTATPSVASASSASGQPASAMELHMQHLRSDSHSPLTQMAITMGGFGVAESQRLSCLLRNTKFADRIVPALSNSGSGSDAGGSLSQKQEEAVLTAFANTIKSLARAASARRSSSPISMHHQHTGQ